ncbi:MAG: hypothetical protein JXA46_09920 [Dehalococcoidales bacterium]|nr:hypothetical protein [Dehalococcoidales bacterium]
MVLLEGTSQLLPFEKLSVLYIFAGEKDNKFVSKTLVSSEELWITLSFGKGIREMDYHSII